LVHHDDPFLYSHGVRHDDLAVGYVFCKDKLGKLSDVNSKDDFLIRKSWSSRITVAVSIVEGAQYGMSTNVNIVAGFERVSRGSCSKKDIATNVENKEVHEDIHSTYSRNL
jgi:hypothetical protein